MEFDGEGILKIDEALGDHEEKLRRMKLMAPLSIDVSGRHNVVEVEVLLHQIHQNFHGSDMVLNLFVTALNSYRSDRCLRPFPPSFIIDEVKDFQALKYVCDSIPPLKEIIAQVSPCSDKVLRLLIWLFVEKGYPTLHKVNYDENCLPSKIPKTFRPHHIFEVCYQDKINEAFKTRQGSKDLILAYHGSTVDNFYSILKVGLQQHFSIEKEVLFGNGIYLSNEFMVSAHFSPFGQTWKNCSLDSKHSIIAVCEIINDLEKVRCKDAVHKRRSVNADSLGEIPDKYFVVTDSDMVRVKYLLVYKKDTVRSVRSYILSNMSWILLVFYFLMLVIIGFNSDKWKRYTRYFSDIFGQT